MTESRTKWTAVPNASGTFYFHFQVFKHGKEVTRPNAQRYCSEVCTAIAMKQSGWDVRVRTLSDPAARVQMLRQGDFTSKSDALGHNIPP